MILELHMLQNFAPSCLNRDDTNSPKDCEFGGYRRGRISSQCQKRSIRWHYRMQDDLQAAFALRSWDHARQIAKVLAEDNANPRDLNEALNVSRYMFQKMGFKEKKGRLTVMLLLGSDEIITLAKTAQDNWDTLQPLANARLLLDQLAERIAGWLIDLEDDSEMLAKLIANDRAGRVNASTLQKWLEFQQSDWQPALDAVCNMSDDLRSELRELFLAGAVEESVVGEEVEDEEYVPKKAANLFKGKRNKGVADALKGITITKAGASSGGDQAKSKEAQKKLNEVFKPLKKLATKAVNVAMFGRMIAEIKTGDMTVDAACQVAHAISTNRVVMDMDYFTAVEELKELAREQGEERDAGAGMIGTVEFNSSCFYRYASIDLCQLLKNLQGDEELAAKTATAFIRASIEAIPTGKQNTFAAHNPPDFIMAVVRKSGQWNLANAFVQPARSNDSNDLVAASAVKLADYWNKLSKMFGANGINASYLWRDDTDLAGLNGSRVASVDDLIKSIEAKLSFDDFREVQ